MKYILTVKKLAASCLLFSVLALSSCSAKGSATVTFGTANPLFNAADIQGTSLQSGNMHYSGFLTSDGSVLFYQSVDGKSLVKSDYDGQNAVVLSNRFPSFINVVDNMVYFVEGSASGKIYKVDIDGKGETMVIDANVQSLIVTSDYMFFIDTKDGFVYYCLHDGSKKTLLLDKITNQIQLIDGKLYLLLAERSKGIYVFPVKNLETISKAASTAADSPSESASMDESLAALSVNADSTASDSKGVSATSAVKIQTPRTDVGFKELVNSMNEFKSMNIQDEQFFYIDNAKNSFIIVNKDKNQSIFLKKSLLSDFIISNKYVYYINPEDESRLYRISITDSPVNKMVVNDRVFQFVVCGNSIYYRREGKLEIFRASIEGGISDKIA